MLTLVGVGLMRIGLLGYTELWRSWSLRGYFFYVSGLFWWGLGIILISTAHFFAPLPPWLSYPMLAVLLVGEVGVFYLPPFMTPPWFRAMRRVGR